jgi:hypothetical protein
MGQVWSFLVSNDLCSAGEQNSTCVPEWSNESHVVAAVEDLVVSMLSFNSPACLSMVEIVEVPCPKQHDSCSCALAATHNLLFRMMGMPFMCNVVGNGGLVREIVARFLFVMMDATTVHAPFMKQFVGQTDWFPEEYSSYCFSSKDMEQLVRALLWVLSDSQVRACVCVCVCVGQSLEV